MSKIRDFSWGAASNEGDHLERFLRIEGQNTPFFITTALNARGTTQGLKFGLFQAGAKMVDNDPMHMIALELGRGERLAPLKIKGELLARQWAKERAAD